ncbi:MAG: HAD-IIIA family hydrolase [Acidobacteria bacterium]|nr:HAD-IIIA family hydrolase [Acidobacteriota bacterium]
MLDSTAAVFFDVDYTLIYPGPTFEGEGYRRFAAAHGLAVDPARYVSAVAAASVELESAGGGIYRSELFVRFARRVLEEMGAAGAAVEPCAREIYEEWAACRHFSLYDDVRPALRALHGAGVRMGLISNTHRCLASLQQHFDLAPYIGCAVSSSDHGYMKPHPDIFREALRQLGAQPREAVMVGDSLTNDIEGARRIGMRGILVSRSGAGHPEAPAEVPVVRTLCELPRLLIGEASLAAR